MLCYRKHECFAIGKGNPPYSITDGDVQTDELLQRFKWNGTCTYMKREFQSFESVHSIVWIGFAPTGAKSCTYRGKILRLQGQTLAAIGANPTFAKIFHRDRRTPKSSQLGRKNKLTGFFKKTNWEKNFCIFDGKRRNTFNISGLLQFVKIWANSFKLR